MPSTTLAFYFEVVNPDNNPLPPGKKHQIQFCTTYQHSSGSWRMRVTTLGGPWHNDPNNMTDVGRSFDQEAAAVRRLGQRRHRVEGRRRCDGTQHEQDSGHQEEDCLRDAPREDSRTPSHSFLSLARPPGLVCPAISLSKIFSETRGRDLFSILDMTYYSVQYPMQPSLLLQGHSRFDRR